MYRFLDAGTMVTNFAKSCADAVLAACTTTGIKDAVQLGYGGSTAAYKIIEALMPVGWGFLLIVFCLDLMQKTYQDNFSIQQLIGPFCKLIAGVVAISMCRKLLDGLYDMCNGFLTVVDGVDFVEGNMGFDTAEHILEKFQVSLDWVSVGGLSGVNGGFTTGDLAVNIFAGLLLIVQMFPAWICSKALQIYLTVTCFYRTIEFWIRGAFLPIACADLLHNGTNSHGLKYCFKIIAVGLQGVVILVLYNVIASVISGSGIAWLDPNQHIVIYICVTCVLCFFGIRFSKQIANDVFNS